MIVALILLSGVLWTLVYLDCIRLGFKQKTYAIPLWALALNFNWELLHTIFGFTKTGFGPQQVINGTWMVFDVLILVTLFKFGHRHKPQNVSRSGFIAWAVFALVASFAIQFMFILEFPRLSDAAAYSAYLQNVVMSVLFIGMLVQRNSSVGQSQLIAWSKFIGTLIPSLTIGLHGSRPSGPFHGEPSSFILVLGIICAILDVTYIVLLTRKQREEKARAA